MNAAPRMTADLDQRRAWAAAAAVLDPEVPAVNVEDLGILRSAEGVLHMIGVPRYDPTTRILRFEDVAYDLDTRNVLLRMANWAMHDDFLAGVQAALEFDIGDSLDSTLASVNESAANLVVSEQLTLHVQLERMDIGPVLVSDQAIVIVGLAGGFGCGLAGGGTVALFLAIFAGFIGGEAIAQRPCNRHREEDHGARKNQRPLAACENSVRHDLKDSRAMVNF